MIRTFNVTETVTYNHIIEVDCENEDGYDEVSGDVIDAIFTGEFDSVNEIAHHFERSFGSENVTLSYDDSGNVSFEV